MFDSPFALLLLTVPFFYLASALLVRSASGAIARTRLIVRISTLLASAVALLCAASLLWAGPASSVLIGIGEFGLSARLDALSAGLLVLVTLIGIVVTEYAHNYLDGEARQGLFMKRLCLALSAVALLVIAGNLVQLLFAWVATSLALHTLLLFHPERPGAVSAARKKFLVARVGDGLVLLAIILLAASFHTTDIATLLMLAREAGASGTVPIAVPLAAGAIALAAMLKSAQFPTHGWLLEVMETPTPVSALLHAGIVNAGGFLVLRFADLMLLAPLAMSGLAVVGALTALIAATVMLTQTSIKVTLAWSTVAQMGFMLLQCGLGAFSAAALHLVAHSFYKAHAFLSSGEAVAGISAPRAPVHAAPVAQAASLLAVLAGYGGLLLLLPGIPGPIAALGALFVIGLWRPLVSARRGASLVPLMAMLAGLGGLWLLLQRGAAHLLADVLPMPVAAGPVGNALLIALVAAAALLAWLQVALVQTPGSAPWLQRLRVHLAAGLYANLLFDRIIGAHRVDTARIA